MDSFSNLLLYFTIYSFMGWLLETTYASLRDKKFINRGFLTGTFCPIYGLGALLVIEVSRIGSIFSKNYVTEFAINILFSIVMVTVLEYLTGFILEKIFHSKWWDYSDNRANLQGYICLKYSLLWGMLAFLLVEAIHPMILHIVFSIPGSIKGETTALLQIYFIADTVKSVIDALHLREVILNSSKISSSKYYEKIVQYKRIFLAFPRLLMLNADILNRDVRSILNEKVDQIKVELKNRYR